MKMKTTICLLVGLTWCLSVSANVGSFQAKLAKESLLLDIASNGKKLIAVGERGHILVSSDGQSWEQKTVPTLATLTAVEFVGDSVWAVGHDATILYLENSEADWQVQMFAPERQKPLLDVLFFDAVHGIAVGSYGSFYRTRDAGRNWTLEAHTELLHPDDIAYLEEIKAEDEQFYREELGSIMPHINRVTKVGNKVFLAGESGLLASSNDQGMSWQRLDIDYMGSFFDITQLENDQILVAGLRGNLFSYKGDSQSWQPLSLDNTASLNSIVPINQQQTVVVGNSGVVVCLTGDDIKVTQTEDKKAITNAVSFNDQLIAVTATGINTLTACK